MIRESAAIGSWLVLIAVAFLPTRERPQASRLNTSLAAIAFIIAAAATRFWFQETRSRWLILVFAAAAVVVVLLRSEVLGRSRGLSTWALWTGSANVAVVAVRCMIEGLPL